MNHISGSHKGLLTSFKELGGWDFEGRRHFLAHDVLDSLQSRAKHRRLEESWMYDIK